MNHGGKKTVICLDNVIVQVMESGGLKTFQWMSEVVKYMLITNMNIIPLPLLLHRAEEIKIYWKSQDGGKQFRKWFLKGFSPSSEPLLFKQILPLIILKKNRNRYGDTKVRGELNGYSLQTTISPPEKPVNDTWDNGPDLLLSHSHTEMLPLQRFHRSLVSASDCPTSFVGTYSTGFTMGEDVVSRAEEMEIIHKTKLKVF